MLLIFASILSLTPVALPDVSMFIVPCLVGANCVCFIGVCSCIFLQGTSRNIVFASSSLSYICVNFSFHWSERNSLHTLPRYMPVLGDEDLSILEIEINDETVESQREAENLYARFLTDADQFHGGCSICL